MIKASLKYNLTSTCMYYDNCISSLNDNICDSDITFKDSFIITNYMINKFNLYVSKVVAQMNN